MEQNGNQNMPPATLCRAGCGFYANDSFDGMCSKCYKDALKRKNNSSSPVTGRGSPGEDSSVSSVSSALAQASLENVSSPIQETCSGQASVRSLPLSGASIMETASPTVTVVPTPEKISEDSSEGGATGGATASTATDDDSSQDDSSNKKPKKNRCHTCKKKVGLTGFECRCGGLYCGLHRYSDKHSCSFDYREMAQEQIRKNNPVIVGEKIQKI